MKKRLLICCDGTWNDLEMRYITNVGRLAQASLPEGEDGVPQFLYYDDGVGSYSSGLKRMIEGGVGVGLERNIYEAYRFLCFNYNAEAGDEICLFGFSRGAYTVRSLGGMIGRLGLPGRLDLKHIPQALELYRSRDEDAQKAFREAYSREAKIRLLACWDTVGAMGIPDKVPFLPFDNFMRKKYIFNDTVIGDHIENALHAIAIDERRKEFDVTRMTSKDGAPARQVTEVWFPGDHGSVGGGTWEKRGLSNAALRWMLEEAKKRGIPLGYDLSILSDRAVEDPSIFLDNEVGLIYGDKARKMTADDALHPSVKQRWRELPDYRPPMLKKHFADALDRARVVGARKQANASTTLAVGKSAATRVWAEKKDQPSGIHLEIGGNYRLRVSALQVWKDGDLDPCDLQGWTTSDDPQNTMRAWKDGKQHNFNRAQRAMIDSAAKNRLVPDANWFNLVMKVGTADWQIAPLSLGTAAPQAFTGEFTAPESGEVRFAANDLASRWDIIDKYDNNQGWIWVEVERMG